MSEVKEHIKSMLRRIPMHNSVSDGSPEGGKTQSGLIEDDSAAASAETPIHPSPSGEVEKAIEDHWINCMALAIRACNPAVNGDEIRAGLDKADAELRAFITTYAEDAAEIHLALDRVGAPREVDGRELALKERAEAAQTENERLRARVDELVTAGLEAEANETRAVQAAEEMRKALEGAEARIEELMSEVEGMRDAITHPNGKRAYSIDSQDQIRVDALTEVLDKALSARTALMKGGE